MTLFFCFKYLIKSISNTGGTEIGEECSNPIWVGDGYCDDDTNTESCGYDGGDCCGFEINTDYCVECNCYTDNTGPVEACEKPDWVGDGYCDDETNTEVCDYDGGDCCVTDPNTEYCSQCLCVTSGGGGKEYLLKLLHLKSIF